MHRELIKLKEVQRRRIYSSDSNIQDDSSEKLAKYKENINSIEAKGSRKKKYVQVFLSLHQSLICQARVHPPNRSKFCPSPPAHLKLEIQKNAVGLNRLDTKIGSFEYDCPNLRLSHHYLVTFFKKSIPFHLN